MCWLHATKSDDCSVREVCLVDKNHSIPGQRKSTLTKVNGLRLTSDI